MQLEINSWWRSTLPHVPPAASEWLLLGLRRLHLDFYLGICFTVSWPSVGVRIFLSDGSVTTAKDAPVQRSGSLRLHVLSLIVWRTAMFGPFLFPCTWLEGYFQLWWPWNTLSLSHRPRDVRQSHFECDCRSLAFQKCNILYKITKQKSSDPERPSWSFWPFAS